jgi:S1-C subfamily serine protease
VDSTVRDRVTFAVAIVIVIILTTAGWVVGTATSTGETESSTLVPASVLRVRGLDCHDEVFGSALAVAPHLAVTNAHVVAGTRSLTLDTGPGSNAIETGTVVAFDPGRDLAVLRTAATLAVPTFSEPTIGEKVTVLGFPGGGARESTAATVLHRILAISTDIYGRGTHRRSVWVLDSRLQPGDSGGPVVRANGSVAGLAFAVARGGPTTAYALADSEIMRVVQTLSSVPVSTGPCLAGKQR